MTRKRTVLLLTLTGVCLSLLVATSGLAQEEAEKEGPRYPFFYLIKNKVDPGMMPQYRVAIGQILAAHNQHENGNLWAAYTPLTGGPHSKFYYFLPMDKMGTMDGWTPNMQVVTEAMGAEAAGSVFQTINEAAEAWDMVLGYNEKLSRPPADPGPAVPNFLWLAHFQVEPTKIGEFMALTDKFSEAHAAHEKGLNWSVYNNVIGGDGVQFWYFLPFEKMGDIDGWASGQEILVGHFGQEGADAISTKLAEVAKSRSVILTWVPGMSRVPSE